MQDVSIIITKLRETYTRLTGVALHASLHQDSFYRFAKLFNEQDLADVLDWLKRQNAKNRYQYSMRLTALIGDLEHFDELLGLARVRRPKTRTNAEQAVDEFRGYRPELPTEANVIHFKDALRKAIA